MVSLSETETRDRSYGWLVWGLGTSFYLFQFVLRASPSVMADKLMSAFMIQASSLGVLASCYYYAYATLQIPIGVFLDRWGPKVVTRTAILLCITGVLIFSSAHSFFLASVGRIFIGAGASGAFLSTITLARHWLPPTKVAFAVGTTIAFGKLGGVLSGVPLATFVHAYGWRFSLFALFLLGAVLASFIWFTLENNKDYSQEREHTPLNEKIRLIFRSRNIWCISLYGCLMYVPLSVFTDIWGVSFLMQQHGINKSIASLGVSLVFVGTAIGAPFIALLSDKQKKRKPLMAFSALASLLVCSLLVFANIPLWTRFVLLFFMGFFMTGQTLVFTAGAELMPRHIEGLTTGFVNTVVMMGGVVFQPLVGFVLDFVWSGRVVGGVPLYTAENYRVALSIIPICMLITTFLLFAMPETYPQKRD